MKKRNMLMFVLWIAAVLCLAGCRGDVGETAYQIGESSLYSEQEIQAAMDAAVREFRMEYQDCKLLDIRYDEGKTLSESAYRQEKGETGRIMVLLSDFEVGDHADAGFTPNDTYKNWKWIMANSGSGWTLLDCGYG